MPEVSWHPNYNIEIKDVDSDDVFYFREALIEYKKKNPTQTPEVFSKIIAICDTIIKTDDP